jgi:aminoglycoside phosphotransferase family enzyme
MTKEEIDKLIGEEKFPEHSGRPDLIETHISWVLLCERYAYKIKKPVQYSFLDFSTLEKRKYYCEREIELNKRLTDNIYIDVQPIWKMSGLLSIYNVSDEIVDYAVRMRKVDRSRQMDLLLFKNEVTTSNILDLCKKIAAFHKNADIIYHKDISDIQKKFNDLEQQKDFLRGCLNSNSSQIIGHAINVSDVFLQKNQTLIATRQRAGFFRDGHGDLHSRNIFILPSGPQPFDCIEFNDDYRQIDVLNEVAFLCMDLDAFDRQDLSDLFLNYYNNSFPAMNTEEDRKLFVYYKSYRANIRAKVYSLRARSATSDTSRNRYLAEASKYLKLMERYMQILLT